MSFLQRRVWWLFFQVNVCAGHPTQSSQRWTFRSCVDRSVGVRMLRTRRDPFSCVGKVLWMWARSRGRPGTVVVLCHTRRPPTSTPFFRDELLSLSALKVTQAAAFDEFGHGVKDGLHDLRLGPSTDMQFCDTCLQQGLACPGHVGHVELPLPCFNPLFFQFTQMLLRGSCPFCHKLFAGASSAPAIVLLAQLEVLSWGQVSLVDTLSSTARRLSATDKGGTQSTLLSLLLAKNGLRQVVNWLLKQANVTLDPKLAHPQTYCSRNMVEMRSLLVKAFEREHLFRRMPKCPYCTRKMPNWRHDYHLDIRLDFTSRAKKDIKTEPEDVDVDMDYGQTDTPLPVLPLQQHSTAGGRAGAEHSRLQAIKHELQEPLPLTQQSGVAAIDHQLAQVTNGRLHQVVWRGSEARDHLRQVWLTDGPSVLARIYPVFSTTAQVTVPAAYRHSALSCPIDILFFDVLPVMPPKFRPPRRLMGNQFEHAQTTHLKKVIEEADTVRAVVALVQDPESVQLQSFIERRLPGKMSVAMKMHMACNNMQFRVNMIYDQKLDKMNKETTPGLRQLLEKKEGLFRKNMMGKRVNFACRSVITPDPYLAVDEVGVPVVFAQTLTVTQPLNDLNLPIARKLVLNGPETYPGANFIVSDKGVQQYLPAGKERSQRVRVGSARRLHTPYATSLRNTASILRHVNNTDSLMMNRQPTLHKPSIMGHRVRVLTGQKALRLNYAPCKAYNADFDGDEMNGHLVQDPVARAEVSEIVSARQNYLVPKDGTPILGLIQDHVVAGVLLSLRDRFFERSDFYWLVMSAFGAVKRRMVTVPPCIVHPKRLWSGKQVISAVIMNSLPEGVPLLSMQGRAKTAVSNWQVQPHPSPPFDMSDSNVIIRNGELLCGVLDKSQFGATAYGLIHVCFELYGAVESSALLSAFSRLFTSYLQTHGFTLGVADILIEPQADKERRHIIKRLQKCGPDVIRKTFNLPEDASDELLRLSTCRAYNNRKQTKEDVKQLDYNMKQATDVFNDKINKCCVPNGLQVKFPSNALQLMIQSGAKGTLVNSIQISCSLGQIELEGCRPPLTAVGRSVPSFEPYDPSPRAGGFVEQRFLTGIKPQELFFHTMAGREGLIDTAVKTSRSGYLQRCIIKHLEALSVHYDMTVRDSDKSVVQFRYGEDGMDIGKVQFLKKKAFQLLYENRATLQHSTVPKQCVSDKHWKRTMKLAERQYERICKTRAKVTAQKLAQSRVSGFIGWTEQDGAHLKGDREHLCKAWHQMTPQARDEYRCAHDQQLPVPVNDKLNPTQHLGSLSEKLLDEIRDLTDKLPVDQKQMRQLMYWRGLRAHAEPGENVGLLAAQSIGEPSTQMTLNTFHFAGRGEMNVTLGIPRLREILMTASKQLSTPTASVPLRAHIDNDRALALCYNLDKVLLKSVLARMSLTETLTITPRDRYRRYKLKLVISRTAEREPPARHLSRAQILRSVEYGFVKRLCTVLNKRQDDLLTHRTLHNQRVKDTMNQIKQLNHTDQPDQTANMSDDDDAELGAASARVSGRGDERAHEYEGEDEEQIDAGVQIQDMEAEDMDDSEDELHSIKQEDDASVQSANTPVLDASRIQHVLRQSSLVVDYEYDTKAQRWAIITLQLPIRKSKLDVTTIVRREVNSYVVQQVAGIEKCILRTADDNTLHIQTSGINLAEFCAHPDLLELNMISTNDIHRIAGMYGIEAAAKALIEEVKNVFGAYGIEVDPRHLSLLTDYMTFTGVYSAFNRAHMSTSPSPIQQMTFETTAVFLRQALMNGHADSLQSPSSSVVMGGLCGGGTGSFDLLLPWDKLLQNNK